MHVKKHETKILNPMDSNTDCYLLKRKATSNDSDSTNFPSKNIKKELINESSDVMKKKKDEMVFFLVIVSYLIKINRLKAFFLLLRKFQTWKENISKERPKRTTQRCKELFHWIHLNSITLLPSNLWMKEFWN